MDLGPKVPSLKEESLNNRQGKKTDSQDPNSDVTRHQADVSRGSDVAAKSRKHRPHVANSGVLGNPFLFKYGLDLLVSDLGPLF